MNSTGYHQVPAEMVAILREAVNLLPARARQVGALHWNRTPERLARYLTHLGRGGDYTRWTTFEATTRHMIVVPHIPFWSACSHHMLPFIGTASVGYIPKERIIGLSKIPLLVRDIAQGFWIQEDLTKAISDKLDELLSPSGIGVQIRAQHTCQLLDVGVPIPWMVTTELHGFMLHTPAAKSEFLAAISGDHE